MESKKFQVTLSRKTMDLLDKLCDKKGLKKSVVIALAIEDYFTKGDSNAGK